VVVAEASAVLELELAAAVVEQLSGSRLHLWQTLGIRILSDREELVERTLEQTELMAVIQR
jgi:hypothetical protein